ncbi:MAG: hypothetical protein K5930_00485 [Treponemataceae bacterium]|nr:hypothetical protein [Treponemataceae bacterium]
MTCTFEKTTFTECLIALGLTRQEALIYQSLLKHGEMTGYEVSKETGISRSNAYASLAALSDKGAAYTIRGEAVKYSPVTVENFVDNTLTGLAEKGEFLKAHAPERIDTTDGYMTIQGNCNICMKIRQMVKEMEYRMYLMAPYSIISLFEKDIIACMKNGRKVVILTDKPSAGLEESFTEEAKKQGSAVYITDAEQGQIRFITDSAYVLTGEMTGSESDTCLYSGQKNLVSVMKEALKNKITLLNI